MSLCKTVFNNAIAAGMAICMAAVVYLQCENKTVGAFLFSLGLLTVIIFKKKLYTGCTGYLADARILNDMYRHDFPGIGGFCVLGYMERFRELMVILFGNVIGAALIGTVVAFTIPDARDKATALMQDKEAIIWYSVLMKSVLCGALMQIAFRVQRADINIVPVAVRYPIAVMCIMAFILAGFEHSIADIAYAFIAWNWSWQTAILLGLATIGNFIGGDQTFRLLE